MLDFNPNKRRFGVRNQEQFLPDQDLLQILLWTSGRPQTAERFLFPLKIHQGKMELLSELS